MANLRNMSTVATQSDKPNVTVRFKKPGTLRYDTLGDYVTTEDGVLEFDIADTGNRLYNKLILIHEMIEQTLTEYWGITEAAIDEYDFAHPDSDDPGMNEDCIYRNEHQFATSVEMAMCALLGVSWKSYDETILRLDDSN